MSDDWEDPANELFTGVDDVTDRNDETDPVFTPEDRPRGILSPTDREYLCGLKEYAQPQTDANRRQAIRERVGNGLKDFLLLGQLLEPTEREKVFEELGPEERDDVLSAMLAFAYLGLDGEQPRLQAYRTRHPPRGERRQTLPIVRTGDERGRVDLGRTQPRHRKAPPTP